MAWSIGKDLKSNTQGYRSLRAVLDNEDAARPDLAASGLRYDPTNGSASPTDIYRFGEAAITSIIRSRGDHPDCADIRAERIDTGPYSDYIQSIGTRGNSPP